MVRGVQMRKKAFASVATGRTITVASCTIDDFFLESRPIPWYESGPKRNMMVMVCQRNQNPDDANLKNELALFRLRQQK